MKHIYTYAMDNCAEVPGWEYAVISPGMPAFYCSGFEEPDTIRNILRTEGSIAGTYDPNEEVVYETYFTAGQHVLVDLRSRIG